MLRFDTEKDILEQHCATPLLRTSWPINKSFPFAVSLGMCVNDSLSCFI